MFFKIMRRLAVFSTPHLQIRPECLNLSVSMFFRFSRGVMMFFLLYTFRSVLIFFCSVDPRCRPTSISTLHVQSVLVTLFIPQYFKFPCDVLLPPLLCIFSQSLIVNSFIPYSYRFPCDVLLPPLLCNFNQSLIVTSFIP